VVYCYLPLQGTPWGIVTVQPLKQISNQLMPSSVWKT